MYRESEVQPASLAFVTGTFAPTIRNFRGGSASLIDIRLFSKELIILSGATRPAPAATMLMSSSFERAGRREPEPSETRLCGGGRAAKFQFAVSSDSGCVNDSRMACVVRRIATASIGQRGLNAENVGGNVPEPLHMVP